MERKQDQKDAVNPAARRDEPRPVREPTRGREERREVSPVQEEPLDPLDPGGIGS